MFSLYFMKIYRLLSLYLVRVRKISKYFLIHVNWRTLSLCFTRKIIIKIWQSFIMNFIIFLEQPIILIPGWSLSYLLGGTILLSMAICTDLKSISLSNFAIMRNLSEFVQFIFLRMVSYLCLILHSKLSPTIYTKENTIWQ